MIVPNEDEMIAEILGLPDDDGNVPFNLYWQIKCLGPYVAGMGSRTRVQGYYGKPEAVNTGGKKLVIVNDKWKK